MGKRHFTITKQVSYLSTMAFVLIAGCGKGLTTASNNPDSSFQTSAVPGRVTATLTWDDNTENTLSGYKVYYGTVSGQYSTTLDVGRLTPVAGTVSFDVANLLPGTTYYFAVQAYDSSQNLSPISDEVIWSK